VQQLSGTEDTMFPRRSRSFLLLPTLAILAAGALGACAAFQDKAEYGAYRTYRLTEAERPRLLAAQRYVSTYPDGEWVDVVQAERTERETAVYQQVAAKTDRGERIQGLEFYLAAYPEGRYAGVAEQRLSADRIAEQEERERIAAAEEEVERQREEALERRRTWVTRATQFWGETLLTLENWGSPIAAVARRNERFSENFGNSPRPRCSRQECVKFYELPYGIRVPGGTRIERAMNVTLRLRFEEGKLEATEVLYPNKGFSRWYENEDEDRDEQIIDEDPASRQKAVDWALERIMPLIEQFAANAQPMEQASLDVIDPLTVDAPEEAEAIAGVSDEPEPEPEPEPEAEEEGGALTQEQLRELCAGDQSALTEEQRTECLLLSAAGEEQEGDILPGRLDGDEDDEEDVEEPEEPQFYPPEVIRAVRTADLEVLVFIAPIQAQGEAAYDGFVIRHVTGDDEEAEGDDAAGGAEADAG
jgi:hypothetical protein